MSSLEKKLVICLAMALLIAAFIPFYWLRESARQAEAMARIQGEKVVKGGEIYRSACAACHGQQAQGGIGPALVGADANLTQQVVRSGKGIMPRFGTRQINDRELEDIIAFLGSLK